MSKLIPTFLPPAVILSPETLRYNPCNDLIFPCVVQAKGVIDKPLGTYYMYYAPHDAPGGICLAYADAPAGPWIEYDQNPIIQREWAPHFNVSHISSPHALWMPKPGKLFLYFHGENDTTRLAVSSDGIHFEYQGTVVATQMYDRISESSYARVFPSASPSRGQGYVMLFMGNNEGTRRIYAAWSPDGITFEARKKPLISPPPGTEVTQVGAPWYTHRDGRNLVIFHGDKTPPDLRNLTTDLYVADVGPDFTEEDHLGVFYKRQEVSESNERVSDPCLFHAEGHNWLFLSIGPRLGQKIAVAREISL